MIRCNNIPNNYFLYTTHNNTSEFDAILKFLITSINDLYTLKMYIIVEDILGKKLALSLLLYGFTRTQIAKG
jgi:hypothetical protein